MKDLADQVQLDLVDMGKYGNKNKGLKIKELTKSIDLNLYSVIYCFLWR